MRNFNYSKNFKIFNSENTNTNTNTNLFNNKLKTMKENMSNSINDTKKIMEDFITIYNNTNKRYIFIYSNDIYKIDPLYNMNINFIQKTINDISTVCIDSDNNISIKKDIFCIMYFQVLYNWTSKTSKFYIDMFHNEKKYKFTIGWDSFMNRINIYNKQISLNLKKNDKISFILQNNTEELNIQDIILYFEET
jgi:hypothetical protein